MEHLKNKSEINSQAAKHLHEKCLYPSVIHCAYYSCIQLMRHIWVKYMGRTLSEIGQRSRNSSQGSHELLINGCYQFLGQQGLDQRNFNEQINQLKRLRVKADYDDIQIDSSKSRNSITLSNSILTILKAVR